MNDPMYLNELKEIGWVGSESLNEVEKSIPRERNRRRIDKLNREEILEMKGWRPYFVFHGITI